MTRDPLSDLSIATADEFENALTAVVEAAIKDGVNVRGAWEFRTAESTHNWEVEIVELAKEYDSEK